MTFLRPYLLTLQTIIFASIAFQLPSYAQEIEEVIVAIECRGDGGKSSLGSGVVVSSDGHVLTARHVVYGDGDNPLVNPTCRGSLGVREPNDYRTMTLRQTAVPSGIDVAVLQFVSVQNKPFAKYCEKLKLRGDIFVAGFPSKQPTGVPSFRQGVLSTIFPDGGEIIETDGQTIGGMSGGPVFSKNLKGLVGLVIGAKFASGGVSYYGILPVNKFANELKLTASDEACYQDSKIVDLSGVGDSWKSGEVQKPLGVKPSDGFCFLSRVFGDFNHPTDEVAITIENDEYALTGNDSEGGGHGGVAQCIWYD